MKLKIAVATHCKQDNHAKRHPVRHACLSLLSENAGFGCRGSGKTWNYDSVEEIGDVEQLSKINPLSLPRLYIAGDLVASQNPLKVQAIENILKKNLVQ